MDKLQKFDYMQGIEDKLQQLEVFELFQDLIKQLVVARPDKPLDFILQKLAQQPIRRVFVMGPPGSCRLEQTKALAEYFQWRHITTGDVLRAAAEAKTPCGQRIAQCLEKFQYVDDDIVIECMQKEIAEAEKNNQSWIVDGFPRTRVQALALHKMNIVPDKFIHLGVSQATSIERIKANSQEINKDLYGQELESAAQSVHQNWEVNQNEVNKTFNQFIYFYDCHMKQQQDVSNDLARLLRVRFRNGAPRKPPKVIIVGPTGSGRTTQCEIIAQRFGLVCINPGQLVRDEAERNPGVKIRVQQALDKGEEIPDEVILRQIDARLKESDCKVNGFVLDGFPQTEAQIQLLRASKIKPSLVCFMDQNQDESIRRLTQRRIDPMTGHIFNLEVDGPSDVEVANRLEVLPSDEEFAVRKRYDAWEKMVNSIEEEFKACLLTITSERLLDQVSDQIADAIQNPVF